MVGVGDVGGGHNLAVGEKSAAKITHLYENGWHGGDAPRHVSTMAHHAQHVGDMGSFYFTTHLPIISKPLLFK